MTSPIHVLSTHFMWNSWRVQLQRTTRWLAFSRRAQPLTTRISSVQPTAVQLPYHYVSHHYPHTSLVTLAASSGKRKITVWRSSVRPSVPSFLLTLIRREAHIRRYSPGGSMQSGQGTFPSEYYEDGYTCSIWCGFDAVAAAQLLPTALAGNVKQSLASVCPSVRLFPFCLLNRLTFKLAFVCVCVCVCVCVMTIVHLGLKVKVIGFKPSTV